MADQLGRLGAGRGGVQGGRDPVPGGLGGRVAGLAQQLQGGLDQAGDGLALGLGGRPQLGRALAGQGGLVGGAQPLARGQQQVKGLRLLAGQPIDRPGRQRRPAQRLDPGRGLGVALALEPASQAVPGGHELVGGQPEQLVARLLGGQLPHLPDFLPACRLRARMGRMTSL
jgi:hypothetical protein